MSFFVIANCFLTMAFHALESILIFFINFLRSLLDFFFRCRPLHKKGGSVRFCLDFKTSHMMIIQPRTPPLEQRSRSSATVFILKPLVPQVDMMKKRSLLEYLFESTFFIRTFNCIHISTIELGKKIQRKGFHFYIKALYCT